MSDEQKMRAPTRGEQFSDMLQTLAEVTAEHPLGKIADLFGVPVNRAKESFVTPDDGVRMGAMPVPPGTMGGMNAERARALLAKEFPNVKLYLSDKASDGGPLWALDQIVVPAEARNQGIGSRLMSRLASMADEHGATVSLTPSGDYGGTVSRLKQFYRRFGFEPNTGRKADQAISDAMVRRPRR